MINSPKQIFSLVEKNIWLCPFHESLGNWWAVVHSIVATHLVDLTDTPNIALCIVNCELCIVHCGDTPLLQNRGMGCRRQQNNYFQGKYFAPQNIHIG